MKQKNAQLNVELLFLIACCQVDLSKDDIEFIHTFLNDQQLDTKALLNIATQHGILPLVYKTLKKLRIDNQEHFLKELKSTYTQIAQRNMLMSAELIRIMNLLEKNNIEALAFKGPVLAQMAYGDITLRQYSDLDILIKKKNIFTVNTLLKSKSYKSIFELTSSQEKIWINEKKDFGLFHPDKNILLEIHWALLDEEYPLQLNMNAIWENHKTVKINHQEIQTFSIENLLLFLCIHGSKHLWERLEWIKDVDLLIQTHEIDWGKIKDEVEVSEFEIMFYLGIYLSYILFKTKLPSTLLKHISKDKRILNLSNYIVKNWHKQNKNTIINRFQYKLATFNLIPSPINRLHYFLKSILKPSFNEYLLLDIPKSMHWIYYLIRPYLLIKKYFLSKKI